MPLQPGLSFLNLPPELRDKVYGELLLVDTLRLRVINESCEPGPLGLETAILCVNRQIHEEASSVLYQENCWIRLKSTELESDRRYWSSYALRNPEALDPRLALSAQVEVWPIQEASLDRGALVTIEETVDLGCFLWRCHGFASRYQSYGREMAIEFMSDHPKATSRHNAILDCLKEVFSYENLAINFFAGSRKPFSAFAKMRGRQCKDVDEVSRRASLFYTRAQRYREGGDLLAARGLLFRGLRFLNLVDQCWSRAMDTASWLPVEVRKQMVALALDCAQTSVKIGDLSILRPTIELLVWSRSNNATSEYPDDEMGTMSNDQQAAAYHFLGLGWIATGNKNLAAYCFMEALRRYPGHPGTDETLDELEVQVEVNIDHDDLCARYNIKNFLQPFRHLAEGEAHGISESEQVKTLDRFLASRNDHKYGREFSRVCILFLRTDLCADR